MKTVAVEHGVEAASKRVQARETTWYYAGHNNEDAGRLHGELSLSLSLFLAEGERKLEESRYIGAQKTAMDVFNENSHLATSHA